MMFKLKLDNISQNIYDNLVDNLIEDSSRSKVWFKTVSTLSHITPNIRNVIEHNLIKSKIPFGK